MTYRSVWWHDPLEYGAGLQQPKTWPTQMEQYRRPKDLRYYDLPTENYQSKLYYEQPHIGKPEYRGLFRDRPHTITSYHPHAVMEKPRGYHGRLYYEKENPRFKYQGPPKNDLYWLEMPPYRPTYPRPNDAINQQTIIAQKTGAIHMETTTKMSRSAPTNQSTATSFSTGSRVRRLNPNCATPQSAWPSSTEQLLRTYQQAPPAGTCHFNSNKLTQDGSGYL